MSREEQIREVAGELNAAGHCLRRATEAAKRVSDEDGHAAAQFLFAVAAYAEGWNRKAKGQSLKAKVEGLKSEGSKCLDSERATLNRLKAGIRT